MKHKEYLEQGAWFDTTDKTTGRKFSPNYLVLDDVIVHQPTQEFMSIYGIGIHSRPDEVDIKLTYYRLQEIVDQKFSKPE